MSQLEIQQQQQLEHQERETEFQRRRTMEEEERQEQTADHQAYKVQRQKQLPAPFRSAANLTAAQDQQVDFFQEAARQANEEVERAYATIRSPGNGYGGPIGGGGQIGLSDEEVREGQVYLAQIDNDIEVSQQGKDNNGAVPPMSTNTPGPTVDNQNREIQAHQQSGAFVQGFNPIGQGFNTPDRPHTRNDTRSGNGGTYGRGRQGGRGNYGRGNLNIERVTPDHRGQSPSGGSDESWTRIGNEAAESELARHVSTSKKVPPGAPGGVGYS